MLYFQRFTTLMTIMMLLLEPFFFLGETHTRMKINEKVQICANKFNVQLNMPGCYLHRMRYVLTDSLNIDPGEGGSSRPILVSSIPTPASCPQRASPSSQDRQLPFQNLNAVNSSLVTYQPSPCHFRLHYSSDK